MNKSSVNIFIITMNGSVAEASTCTMKYFNDASVLYMFLTLDIRGMNDIRLISRPIHAPSHELVDTDTNTPLARVTSKRTFVEADSHIACRSHAVPLPCRAAKGLESVFPI